MGWKKRDRQAVVPSPPAYDLTVLRTMELFKLRDFFQRNPAFQDIKDQVITGLTGLARRGIISVSWLPRVRAGGCAGCRRRKLAVAGKALTKLFQRTVLRAMKDEDEFLLLRTRLHGYMEEHKIKPANVELSFIQITGDQLGRRVVIPCVNLT